MKTSIIQNFLSHQLLDLGCRDMWLLDLGVQTKKNCKILGTWKGQKLSGDLSRKYQFIYTVTPHPQLENLRSSCVFSLCFQNSGQVPFDPLHSLAVCFTFCCTLCAGRASLWRSQVLKLQGYHQECL